MADYTPTFDGATADAGNATITGAEHDVELRAIRTALLTKYDPDDLATLLQAKEETLNTVLLSPRSLQAWGNANAGVVGDLRNLRDVNPETTNAGTDLFPYWDDTVNDARTMLAFSQVQGSTANVIGTDSSANIRLAFEETPLMTDTIDTAADFVLFYDSTAAVMRKGLISNLPTTGGGVSSTSKIKAADEAKTEDTTLADDDTLAGFSLDASSTYEVRAWIPVTVASATPDIDFGFQISSAPTASVGSWWFTSTFANIDGEAYNDITTEIASLALASGGTYYIMLEAFIETNAAATLDWQWAQSTSSVDATTVKRGAWMAVYKIA